MKDMIRVRVVGVILMPRPPRKLTVRRRCYRDYRLALYRGVLVRPDTCSRCGSACKHHGHHKDYSKPLDVIWLCVSCHHLEHPNTNKALWHDI